jgi:hypothetical protein
VPTDTLLQVNAVVSPGRLVEKKYFISAEIY